MYIDINVVNKTKINVISYKYNLVISTFVSKYKVHFARCKE